MHSHSGVHGGGALSDGVTTAMAHRPLPWLMLRQWVVDEVEEVMAEWCVRAIAQWRDVGGMRAGHGCGGDGAALRFTRRARERKREVRQRRVSA